MVCLLLGHNFMSLFRIIECFIYGEICCFPIENAAWIWEWMPKSFMITLSWLALSNGIAHLMIFSDKSIRSMFCICIYVKSCNRYALALALAPGTANFPFELSQHCSYHPLSISMRWMWTVYSFNESWCILTSNNFASERLSRWHKFVAEFRIYRLIPVIMRSYMKQM